MKSICSRFHMLILVSMLALTGCSGRQIYQSAAGWRQNECQKILESAGANYASVKSLFANRFVIGVTGAKVEPAAARALFRAIDRAALSALH